MSGARPKVLVIGAGSIGRRHATNLDALGASVTVVDVEMGEVVPSGYDGVVVATPSTLHARHGLAALGTGATVFIEKPLAATVAEARTLLDAGSDRIMVGYNLRYHEPNLRLAAMLEGGAIGRPISYRFWFGHWLPDWRPGTDYRSAYSARSDLGGGVLFEPESPTSLAAAIGQLLDDPARARALGQTGQRAVVERFSSDTMAQNFAQVCGGVIDRFRSSSTRN